MAHELDTTNGTTSFASANVPAWHTLGVVLDGTMDAAAAMRESHLAGWNVRKIPLLANVPDEVTVDGVTAAHTIEIPGKYATVRTNPINGEVEPLGVVGESYLPIQNESSTDLLNALVEESGAHFETAGALRGGRETFVTMKLPETMELVRPDGTIDRTELYLGALNSHDGSSAFRMLVTPVRIVCANTQIAAISRARATWSIRHTSGALNAIAEARHSLGLTFKYMSAFEDECQAMIERSVEEDEIRAMLNKVFETTDKETTERKAKTMQEHVDNCITLLGSPTNGGGVGGTAFGVYNSVTEYVDHHWKLRGAGDRTGVLPESAIRGGFADLKAKAFKIATTPELVNA